MLQNDQVRINKPEYGIVINCSIVVSKQISKINDRSRIGYGAKQRLIEGTDPSKGLTDNDELSLYS